MKTYFFMGHKLMVNKSFGSWHGILRLRWWDDWVSFNFSDKLVRLKYKLNFLRLWPVYAYIGGRDCDGCESTSYYKFPTFYHFHKCLMVIRENAEGPVWSDLVTRKEYLENKDETFFRDRYAEMDNY